MRNYILILNILFICPLSLLAQPNYIFAGGDGDGDALFTLTTANALLYAGGNGKGDLVVEYQSNSTLYDGGVGQGQFSFALEQSNLLSYFGGEGQGHFSAISTQSNLLSFHGGEGQGVDMEKINTANTNLFFGGEDKGYTMTINNRPFLWTGSISTAWDEKSNWNNSIIPDLNRPVIIPDSATRWPEITASLFAIGANPNAATRFCQSLLVENGAQFFTFNNNKIENYGVLQIEGQLFIHSGRIDPIEIFSGGELIIGNKGEVMVK